MKSRISFFNAALAKNALRRTWPAWFVFALVMLAVLPVRLVNYTGGGGIFPDEILRSTISELPYLLFLLAGLVSMLQFSFLYTPRGCGLMNALPLRRETVFGTAWTMGLLPMLVLEAFSVLVLLLLRPLCPVSAGMILRWLAAAAGCTLCFWGVASFCAMLTGNVLVLPAVYAVLNYVAVVVAQCLTQLFDRLLYGFCSLTDPLYQKAAWLCPAEEMNRWLNTDTGRRGLTVVGIYAALGLLLSAAALCLYRRRRMESAGDTVAIPVLKPIFLVCMTLGAALVGSWVLSDLLFPRLLGGAAAFWMTLGTLLIGAFLGWTLGRMVLEKSVRVFHGPWKCLLLCAALLALLCAAAELDAAGFEKRVPEAEDVSSVSVYGGVTLREKENIAAALALQEKLIAGKDRYDTNGSPRPDEGVIGESLILRYTLRDGRTLVREYAFFGGEAELEDPDSVLSRYQALLNTPEAMESRTILRLPFETKTYQNGYLQIEQNGREFTLPLTVTEARDFYENALLPDLREGRIGRFCYDSGKDAIAFSNVDFTVALMAPAEDYPELIGVIGLILVPDGTARREMLWENRFFQIPMDAGHCLRWLEENTPYVPQARESVQNNWTTRFVG